MSASLTDRITDTRNSARPNSARVSSGRAAGASTLACDNLVGWPTASKVHFVTYQIDSSSNPVDGTQLDCEGIVSGNNIGSFTVIDGNDVGNQINDIVEMLPTAAWGQDLADALSLEHTRLGGHKSITTDTITVSSGTTLPAGDIGAADLAAEAVTAAKIAPDAVSDAKLIYGKLRSRQGGSATNWSTVGTTTYDYSATNTFIQTGAIASSASADITVTFPTAFNQVPIVIASCNSASAFNTGRVIIANQTATNFTFRLLDSSDTKRAENINWIAIGE